MNKKIRELLTKILEVSDLDNELKCEISIALNETSIEIRNVEKNDLRVVFAKLDVNKISYRQMELIAEHIKSHDSLNDYWALLENATREVFHISSEIKSENVEI